MKTSPFRLGPRFSPPVPELAVALRLEAWGPLSPPLMRKVGFPWPFVEVNLGEIRDLVNGICEPALMPSLAAI